jgi:hypothetical protein
MEYSESETSVAILEDQVPDKQTLEALYCLVCKSLLHFLIG